ncbi:hypothetical protein HD597_003929 [Nonomuraea thailandensis]|uniref:Uncharacterized protein n=1 Tax=Nonomuraea thailandensis TaxID=1188745 RepID=A0A9X2GD33_9ACTN|nr:hypothetical protein [Nonomuraea thailandensis]MCP2356909.1 hypothetical protein [Nonomuraea thailandensis]
MPLLERLARAERSALQQVDELRTRLAEAEEQARRPSMIRETLMLLADHHGDDGDKHAGGQPGPDIHDPTDQRTRDGRCRRKPDRIGRCRLMELVR